MIITPGERQRLTTAPTLTHSYVTAQESANLGEVAKPPLLNPRWAFSYLRGPTTPMEIRRARSG